MRRIDGLTGHQQAISVGPLELQMLESLELGIETLRANGQCIRINRKGALAIQAVTISVAPDGVYMKSPAHYKLSERIVWGLFSSGLGAEADFDVNVMVAGGKISITCNSGDEYCYKIEPENRAPQEDKEAPTEKIPDVIERSLRFGPITRTGDTTGARERIRQALVPPPTDGLFDDEAATADFGDEDAETSDGWGELGTPHRIEKEDLDLPCPVGARDFVVLQLAALGSADDGAGNQRCLEIVSGNGGSISATRHFITMETEGPVMWRSVQGENLQKVAALTEIDVAVENEVVPRMRPLPSFIPGLITANCGGANGGEMIIRADDENGEPDKEAAWLCTLKVIDPYVAHSIQKIQRKEEHAQRVLSKATFLRKIVTLLLRGIGSVEKP